jgi:hypothetical protein
MIKTNENSNTGRYDPERLSKQFPTGTKVVVTDKFYSAPGTWEVTGTHGRLVAIENKDQKRSLQLFESSIQIIKEESSSN